MSYTGSHLHNFIPGAAPSPQPLADMPLAQPNQRAVRPLSDHNSSPAAPPSASSSSTAQAQAAHLEAHVRMLEQEVHLLRTGLAQNERLRQSTAAPPSMAPPPPKRVHFGPSSVVPIPRVARGGGATNLRTTRKPSTSPQRKLSPATRPGQAGEAYDTRPKLVFGQRVDPTQSRTNATYSTNSNNNTNGNVASTVDATATASSPPTAGGGGGAALSPSHANLDAAMTTPNTTATTTTYVPLTHAPASLRGGNTTGIPLQGAATGATVVSALDGASSSPPPATVWAAADPALLWRRAAVAASASASAGAGGAVVVTDADTAGRGGDVMASYPFRTTVSPPAAVKAVSTTPAVVPAAPPIVVTMSSDGWPPRAAQTNPTETMSPPPTVERTGPGAVVGGVPPSSFPAETAAIPPTPQPTNEILVEELKQHVAALRDTLGQREALLHRVLAELHDKGSPSRNASGQHRGEPEDPSRRTLRLLTQELLNAQTQLSHARASHQLLHEELQRRPQVQQQQQVPSPSSPPPPPPPEPTPAPPAPTPVVMSAPVEAELRSQLMTALQKVKAWEDWYTATEGGAAQKAASPAPEAAAAAAPTSKDKTHDKRKKASHQTQTDAEERNTQRRSRVCGDGCGGCGATGSGVSTRHSGGSPSSMWYSGMTNAPRPHCTASSPPPLSAYAMDEMLYNEFVRSRCVPATVYPYAQVRAPGSKEHASFVVPSTSTTAAAASATPPPEPPAGFRQPRTDASAAPTNQRVESGVVSTVAPVSCTAYYCDDLEHARLQAHYGQHYVTQMAREAAVRELAEVERQVAEERLAVARRHPMTAAATVPDASTPKKESVAGKAVDEK